MGSPGDSYYEPYHQTARTVRLLNGPGYAIIGDNPTEKTEYIAFLVKINWRKDRIYCFFENVCVVFLVLYSTTISIKRYICSDN